MLRRIQIHSLNDRVKHLSDFDPHQMTWVVSDLKAKLGLQKKLLERYNFIPEDAVLRASELWKKIFFRTTPHVSIISKDLAIAIISNELKKEDSHRWAGSSGAPAKMYDFITNILGVLSHPDGHSILGEWFKENLESYMRWGDWYLVGQKIYNSFLSQALLPQDWMMGVLLEKTVSSKAWSRSLLIDMGPDLNAYEADLISNLGKRLEVTVLEPPTDVGTGFDTLMRCYEKFHSANLTKSTERLEDIVGKSVECRRYATQLSEVKDVVASIRQLVDAGVEPRSIAILAPNTKMYDKCLQHYFEVEGVPLQHSVVTVLGDYPDVHRWLSELRLMTQDISTESLESALFENTEEALLSYERFEVLYSKVYGLEDLSRDPYVFQRYQNKKINDTISAKDFMRWSLKSWPQESDEEVLYKVASHFLKEVPDAVVLSLSDWVKYLQTFLRKKDDRISAQDSGVVFENIDSAEEVNTDHTFMLGLTESSLRPAPQLKLNVEELIKLSRDTGLSVLTYPQGRLEYKAHFLARSQKNTILCFPGTDFNGDIQGPALFWLESAYKTRQGDVETVSVPGLTRWDSLQRAENRDLAEARNWSAEKIEGLVNRLNSDMGLASVENFGSNQIISLSAASIEDYSKCPFILAAKKLFKLQDNPKLDIDVDPASKGRIYHKIFERLLRGRFISSRSDEEIENIVEEARRELSVEFGDANMWPILKKKLVDDAKKFLSFESNLRSIHPNIQTPYLELSIQGHLDTENMKFHKQATANSIGFRGFVDRIDTDIQGRAVIFDYKTSKGDISQYGSWLKNNRLQLLVYVWAIEEGLGVETPVQVVGAAYYIVKGLERKYGFRMEGESIGFFSPDEGGENQIDSATKEILVSEIKEKAKLVISGIAKGEFQPKPYDEKICDDCDWRQQCRAPHLN